MGPRTREWLAFFFDWMLAGVVYMVVMGFLALLAYSLLPSGVAFALMATAGVVTMLASVRWLFFSARVVPPSLGRRLLGASDPISAWDAIRGRRA